MESSLFFQYVDEIEDFIEKKDWQGLEEKFYFLCSDLSGKEVADKIKEINLLDYEKSLKEGINSALNKGKEKKAKAVYFEYDMDNCWNSTFFICSDYADKTAGDDDWACDYLEDFEGPSMEGFFNDSFMELMGINEVNLYLIARTVASFGKVSQGIDTEGLALCMAYHDQDPVMRIFEP